MTPASSPLSEAGPGPCWSLPALRFGKILVVADLHIGIEGTLARKGVAVPSGTDAMIDLLIGQGGGKLLILGDLKDSITGTETPELNAALARLSTAFDEILLVKGNHDGGLRSRERLSFGVLPAQGVAVKGVGFLHGHAMPSEEVAACKTVVCAHAHPRIEFPDHTGRFQSERCWVRFPVKGERGKIILVVPAFNPFLSGSSVNDGSVKLLGPLLQDGRIHRWKGMVSSLDGVDLGTLKDLRF